MFIGMYYAEFETYLDKIPELEIVKKLRNEGFIVELLEDAFQEGLAEIKIGFNVESRKEITMAMKKLESLDEFTLSEIEKFINSIRSNNGPLSGNANNPEYIDDDEED